MLCSAQEISPDAYSGLRWRFLGTHRGGRITTVAGVVGHPNLYYAGTPNGGVWKTDDAGHTWKPIFDSVPVPSIGALAVAPSNPNIIYVATGEQGIGHGVFRSADAGATWSAAGLAEEHFISRFLRPWESRHCSRRCFGSPVKSEPRGLSRRWTAAVGTKTLADADCCRALPTLPAPRMTPSLYAALNPPPGGAGEREQPGESQIYVSNDEGSS